MQMLFKFLKNYSKIMRKINNDTSLFKVKVNDPQVSKQKSQKSPKTTRTSRITFALNANVCQQAENWLNSRWVQQDFTYPSLSELIRKSLTAYQEGKIKINETGRDKHASKREITIRFSNSDLLNFYYSLPYSQRTAIIEGSLSNYLERMNSK